MATQSFPTVKRRQELLEALTGLNFDLVIFAEHGRDGPSLQAEPLVCPRLVMRPNGRIVPWPQRWQPFLPDMEAWYRGNEPWNNDLRASASMLKRATTSSLDENPGLKRLLALRVRSVLGLPIYDGDDLIGSILLGSHKTNAYYGAARHMLDQSKAPGVARGILADLERRRNDLIRDMRSYFKPHMSPNELAEAIVKKLAAELDWDYVAIYRIERDEFSLVGSCDRTKKKIFESSQQARISLNRGPMAKALKIGNFVRVDDLSDHSVNSNHAKPSDFPARSTLCYPVKVSGRVEWMLNCASSLLSAFRGPDLDVLSQLVDRLETTLALWLESRLSATILDVLSQSVIVYDRDGIIQRVNKSALAIVGEDLLGAPITSLIHAATSEPFNAEGLRSTRVQVRCTSGRLRPMLATVQASGESFGRWVLELREPDDQQVLAGLQYAKTTVEEVAYQARGPLMLARAMLGRATKTVFENDKIPDSFAEELEKVIEHLGKADITYERLARALAGRDQPSLAKLFQSLQVKLDGEVSNVEVIPPTVNTAVRGILSTATEALTKFVKEAAATTEGPVHLSAEVHPSHISIALSSTDPSMPKKLALPDDLDPFKAVEEAARSAVRAPSSVEESIRSEGWSLARNSDGFEVRIPRITSTGQNSETFDE